MFAAVVSRVLSCGGGGLVARGLEVEVASGGVAACVALRPGMVDARRQEVACQPCEAAVAHRSSLGPHVSAAQHPKALGVAPRPAAGPLCNVSQDTSSRTKGRKGYIRERVRRITMNEYAALSVGNSYSVIKRVQVSR